MNLLFLKEFVDKHGVKIKGDEPINQDDNKSTSKSTTDDFVHTSRQGISRYFNYGRIMSGKDDEGIDLPDEDKKKEGKKIKKELKETSKDKMDKIIEDIFSKKDFDKEFISKKNISDLKLNAIQPIDTIKETNPILLRKVMVLKDLIDKDDITGEEKAIILNHLLDINMTDIPQEYKEELKKKII